MGRTRSPLNGSVLTRRSIGTLMPSVTSSASRSPTTPINTSGESRGRFPKPESFNGLALFKGMKTKTSTQNERGPDLSDRLLAFTSGLLGLSASLPEDRAGGHLAEQLLRTATAAYFRHGEAEGSPSAKDFTEKFRACLVELRTARRTLQLLEKAGLPCDGQAVRSLLEDADTLVRIFFSSIRTLEGSASK